MMGYVDSVWCSRRFLRVLQESLVQHEASTGHTASTNPVLNRAAAAALPLYSVQQLGKGRKNREGIRFN